MKPDRTGAPTFYICDYVYGTHYIDKRLPTVGTTDHQKDSLTETWTLESSDTAIYLQGHLVKRPNWLASLVGQVETVSVPKYALAYRYHSEREDYGDGDEGRRAEVGATMGQNSSLHLAVIYRWELVLVWEYLRQVLFHREKLWAAMRGSEDFNEADHSRAFRWQCAAYDAFAHFGLRLDCLARYELSGQIPRHWMAGKLKSREYVDSIDDFEASFFAQARRYLDGAAVDGPAGYPMKKTRLFDAHDGRQPPFPFQQHKAIDRWDTWIQNDEGIANGTIKTESSASKVEDRLAIEKQGQEDTTPLPGFELVSTQYKPLSTKLTELYDIERSTRRFSPEFWKRGRVIFERYKSDIPLREAIARFENGPKNKALDS